MNNPENEVEQVCPNCDSWMDKVDTYDWICPICGEVYSDEPDWDSEQGGYDYDN